MRNNDLRYGVPLWREGLELLVVDNLLQSPGSVRHVDKGVVKGHGRESDHFGRAEVRDDAPFFQGLADPPALFVLY